MADGLALLERAISYALGSLRLGTFDALPRPTSCRAWDLLSHMYDSLSALSGPDVGPHGVVSVRRVRTRLGTHEGAGTVRGRSKRSKVAGSMKLATWLMPWRVRVSTWTVNAW